MEDCIGGSTTKDIDYSKCLCHELARVNGNGKWCDECLPIPEKYKSICSKINCFNPPQAAAYKLLEENPGASIVVSSGTGTGKTLIAEMAILKYFERVKNGELKKGCKVLVLQPLKALAFEKTEDWKNKFHELNIMSLTSDDDVGFGHERNKNLSKADIIVCSYEMLDSMSRKPSIYTILNDVGLLIIDEIHELADCGRGGGLDGSITRFLKYRKSMGLETQIVGLSATFENVEDLKIWLENFVPVVNIVYKHFSPIEVTVNKDIQLYDYDKRKSVILSSAHLCASEVNGPVLVMVLSKPVLRELKDMIEDYYGEDSVRLHCADLDAEERHQIEDDYRNGKFRFLLATPTLLAGVNLPCQAIVLDLAYFNTDDFCNDVLPIQKINQAKGRVGRLPYYNNGFVTFVSSSAMGYKTHSRLKEKNIVRGTLFNSIDSVINAEVCVNPISLNELLEWYKLTFSKVSSGYDDGTVEYKIRDTVDWLIRHEYIYSELDGDDEKLFPKSKGILSSKIMVSPRFVEHVLEVLDKFSGLRADDEFVIHSVFLEMWSHPLSEIRMNESKLLAIRRFNVDSVRIKSKYNKNGNNENDENNEYDWIKKIRIAIKRLTPFIEKYASAKEKRIFAVSCNSIIKHSVDFKCY